MLYTKHCLRLLLMNGCECILVDIIFADEEDLPAAALLGTPVILKYMPSQLLLRAVDVEWILPANQLPRLEEGFDRRGLFLLSPHTDYLSYPLGEGQNLDVRRTQFEVLPADARIVYSAQGEGFDATIADMEKHPEWMIPLTGWLIM